MAHTMIVGTTMSGKTTLAKRFAREAKQAGFSIIVLDPLKDREWPADFLTSDPKQFLKVAKSNKDCYLFIDEAGENCGHWDKEMFWTATRSRHLGHCATFITQRPTMVSPNVRGQCINLAIFSSPLEACVTMSKDFNQKEILEATRFPQGQFLYTSRFGKPVLYNVFTGKEIKKNGNGIDA
jgi:hypothetical protein